MEAVRFVFPRKSVRFDDLSKLTVTDQPSLTVFDDFVTFCYIVTLEWELGSDL